MVETLLNAPWTRWVMIVVGAIIIQVTRNATDESFRGSRVEHGILFNDVIRESEGEGRINRLLWMGLGVALVVGGLLWTPLRRYLLTRA